MRKYLRKALGICSDNPLAFCTPTISTTPLVGPTSYSELLCRIPLVLRAHDLFSPESVRLTRSRAFGVGISTGGLMCGLACGGFRVGGSAEEAVEGS